MTPAVPDPTVEALSERSWAEAFLREWSKPYFGPDASDAVACVMRAARAARAAAPDPTVEARIAGVLREHARWEHGTGPDGYPTHRCRCGVDLPHGRADRVAPLHREHQAAMLLATWLVPA